MEGAETLRIRQPDDWHLHLRDGDVLRAVAPLSMGQFGRVLVMPNLKPPVKTVADAAAYRDRILEVAPELEPVMTLYLTDETTAEMVEEAARSGFVRACKLYPAGATTNSALGVTSMDAIRTALSAMESHGLILCVHGEVTGVDIFDRERLFVEQVLPDLLSTYPRLKVIVEHVSSKAAVDFVLKTDSPRLAATVTPQHLCFDRNAIFEGSKLHHDMFCLPVLKTEEDRHAIQEALRSNSPHFFAGTDSAPHPRDAKLGGAAGVFSALTAVELYTEAFDSLGILSSLEAFLSERGAAFYGYPPNTKYITLRKKPFQVPKEIHVSSDTEPLTPMRAGETLSWSRQ